MAEKKRINLFAGALLMVSIILIFSGCLDPGSPQGQIKTNGTDNPGDDSSDNTEASNGETNTGNGIENKSSQEDIDNNNGASGIEEETSIMPQITYTIIDTGQDKCYDDSGEILCPGEGEPFSGQDSQYQGTAFSFQDNGDETVNDLNTGLMWQKTPNLDNKSTFAEAVEGADTFSLAGYDDWRLPTIKELYSLIDFRGSSHSGIPYLDTDYFDFRFGEGTQQERIIDSQYWSSTEYTGSTFNGDATVFGVNFADGRIKGYPRDRGRDGSPMAQFVRYVRGNPDYGINNFASNGDGTITDLSTGLMWMEADSINVLDWEEALSFAENLSLAGYDDWRLPNAKELQSIVDYTRAPDAADIIKQGPAIDPIFNISESESWFWTGTTLLETPPQNGISHAVYIAFGQAFGIINGSLLNVHGAGAQRSDPKSGDPADWEDGHGPQGDQIRIFNYVRCVRDAF